MDDIRKKEITVELGGEQHTWCCNFAVLAAVDEDEGVRTVLNKGSFAAALSFATAMYNHEQELRGTLKRSKTGMAALIDTYPGGPTEFCNKVNGLVLQALLGDTDAAVGAAQEDAPKN